MFAEEIFLKTEKDIILKMARAFAGRIDYRYVYRMNIVTIYVAKNN